MIIQSYYYEFFFNMLILKLALKEYWDLNILILKLASKNTTSNFFEINGLNFLLHKIYKCQ